MSKYCVKCGAEIDDQGRFCPVCGTDQLPKIEPTNVICPKAVQLILLVSNFAQNVVFSWEKLIAMIIPRILKKSSVDFLAIIPSVNLL